MNALPIDKFQDKIEKTIDTNPVTIITAETGAGKSTRVPLWLWKKNKKVHVTQPRRIAARSLSLYLAKLTETELGKKVGYQTGFDSQVSKETTLLYVTDGVQMVREIKHRHDYDVLILDEVHEWNLNQEVLAGIIKNNLTRGFYKKNGKRIVIMSATLQADHLSRFLGNAPVISVPGRGFPVSMHHNDPRFLLPDTAQMVELGGNVLVFQPGKQEIDTFIDDLTRMLDAEKIKAKILPLHAELSLKDQARVFEHYPLPKVIVATDIAQTSLTIDDIDAVVDCGIKKEVRLIKGIEGLYPTLISQAECLQRAGRAGRVRPGQYFLCADASMHDRQPFPEPEIQRLNLESVVLRLIKMGISPLDFPFFHSPAKALIFKALKNLKILGALTEAGKVTGDGEIMAELPVSMRSARLLLEAQKGSDTVVDSALKCIAILETKGIVNKEYAGEKYANLDYQSDVLNQLTLWQATRVHKNIISHKKLALAREIYQELKKRIKLPPVKKHLSMQDMDVLFRAILSCFAGEVYTKGGDEYLRENEVRQLDRTSLLFALRPAMLVGLPFDLVITRENRESGQMEQTLLPLITFASELTFELLERLQPFSYYKKEQVNIHSARVEVYREVYFGGRLVKAFTTAPQWKNPVEKEQVARSVLEWFDSGENPRKFDIQQRLERLKEDFNEVKLVVKGSLNSFEYYRKGFLLRELEQNLEMEDLNLFFKLNRGFSRVTLEQLLPSRFIQELKEANWPGFLEVAGEHLEIVKWEDTSQRYIVFAYATFEKINEDDLLLSTGEWVGIILGERRFSNWQEAVQEYNIWKKSQIFEKKYQDVKKEVNIRDIMELEFPQVFESGVGKENVRFEFYIVPQVEETAVYLVHYIEKERAEAYFAAHRCEWDECIRNYKRSQLEDIFKQKGWKVKS